MNARKPSPPYRYKEKRVIMEIEPARKARRTYFIDSENHINTCLQGIESLTENDLVVVFHRESNLSQKQKESIKESPARIEWILCQDSGVKNSLDVQLIAELSRRIACHEIENGYIVSQDQGYKPAIHYLLNRYADEFRFLGLKKSIDEFMLDDALISAETRQDVHEALVRTAGQIIGTAMYRTIRNLFDATTDSDEPENGYTVEGAPLFPESQNEPAQANGSNGNGAQRSKSSKRRKPRSAAKPASGNNAGPSAEATAQAEPQPEPEQAKPQQRSSRRPVSRKQAGAPQAKPARDAAAAPAAQTETGGKTGQPADAATEQAEKPARTKRARQKQAPATEAIVTDEAPTAADTAPAADDAATQPGRRRGRKPAPKTAAAQTPLENLPGIGKALAARLADVGIPTAEALKEKGSRASWALLKKKNPATSINWLYALEGAVLGIAVKELDDETKTALKSFSKLAL